MFARLKEHAVALDNDIKTLERTLESKRKILFSVVEKEVSKSTIEYFKQLISELNDMNNNVLQIVKDNKEKKRNIIGEYNKFWSYIEELTNQLTSMENYLEEFGYVKDSVELSISNEKNINNVEYENSMKQEGINKSDDY